jgi:hypothetical protein
MAHALKPTIAGVALLVAALAATLALTPPASASTGQLSILQDASFLESPATALPKARALGARTIRVFVAWRSIAPHPAADRKPAFDASDPNGYPAAKWAPYDALVKTARHEGITVDLELTGGVPDWAQGRNPPTVYRRNPSFGWRPNVALYGQFVHAVTQRYDGHFTPAGASAALPAVHFWSFWNEPNFGQDLGPQAVDGSTRPIAPKTYRALLHAGWAALHRAQPHAVNTILIGELAATGYALHTPGHPGKLPGMTAQTRALVFLRALYCLGGNYRPLQGSTATRFGCPATAAASKGFRARNPALFDAGGFADHPYASRRAPNANPAKINSGYATFPVLHRVAAALDKVTAAYGSHTRFPVYNDEYGYITSPPQPTGRRYPSPVKAAAYLNQAEYLSYKNPRIASYGQFLLDDPLVSPSHPKAGFASGLYTDTGQPKATLYAYRLPLWLPKQTVHAGSKAEIWGGARPATFAGAAAGGRSVAIQMQRDGHGAWTTIRTVDVAAATGYFDIHMKLPYGGGMRLTYTYPASEPFLPPSVGGNTIYGRTVKVAVTG